MAAKSKTAAGSQGIYAALMSFLFATSFAVSAVPVPTDRLAGATVSALIGDARQQIHGIVQDFGRVRDAVAFPGWPVGG